MFDSLGEIWNANQQRLEQEGVRPGQMNTAGIAGQLIASGMMPQQAYVQAAKIFRDQEIGNIEKQKQQQEQMQQHQFRQLADYVRSNPNVTNQELAGAAMQFGVNPANIPAFLSALGSQDSVVQDPLYGPQIFNKRAGRISQGGQQPTNGMQPFQQTPDMNVPTMDNGMNTQASYQQMPLNRVEAKEKYKSNLRKEERKEKDNAEYEKELTASSKNATALLEKYAQMQELIPKVYSAPGAEIKATIMKGTGLNKQKVADYEKFRSLSSEMVFDLLATQKGVQTDEDRKEMAKTKPGPDNTPEGNLAIAQSGEAMFTRILEYNTAAAEWMNQGGSKTEFEKKWAAYAKSNPLLKRDKNGMLVVNEKNLFNWHEEIFGEQPLNAKNDNADEDPWEREQKRRFGNRS